MTASASLMGLNTEQFKEGNGNNNENDKHWNENHEGNNDGNELESVDVHRNHSENNGEENNHENDNGNNEENEASPLCEGLLQVHLNEETQVCASQEILIDETEEKIITPDDLPDGTTLKVSPWLNDFTESAEVEALDQFIRCGGVYEVLLETSEETIYHEPFTITMNYCNGEAADDIYFFDEDGGDWVKQDGKLEDDTFTISVESTWSGKYGVFALGYHLNEETKGTTKDEVIVIDKKEENEEENKVFVVASNEEKDDRTGFILPSTATNLFNFILIGVGLLLLGGIIIFFTRKRKE